MSDSESEDANPEWKSKEISKGHSIAANRHLETFLYNLAKKTVDPSWLSFIKSAKVKDVLKKVNTEINTVMEPLIEHIAILPQPPNLIFNAFKKTSLTNLKVVIIGQDPYFANVNEAMGLTFSVPQATKVPPSLKVIFKELQRSLCEAATRTDGDLSDWAAKGVFLLNTALTVQHRKAGSHMKIWKDFTDYVIQYVSDNKENIVFMLWGNHAISKKSLIDSAKHYVLVAGHPSPLNTTNPFMGCNHFKLANDYLKIKIF